MTTVITRDEMITVLKAVESGMLGDRKSRDFMLTNSALLSGVMTLAEIAARFRTSRNILSAVLLAYPGEADERAAIDLIFSAENDQ